MAKKEETKSVRLRNITSGAIVNVPEEKVERLGAGWESADAKKSSTSAKK